MTTLVSQFSNRNLPVINGDCAGDIVANQFFMDVTAAQIVLNDIIDIGVLPAGHTVVNCKLIPDDLDTNGTPTIKLDVGLMSGTPGDPSASRTCGAEFFSQDTSAQTGVVSNMTLASGYKVKPTSDDRSIGVKFQTAAATAAAGRIRLLVEMAAMDTNVQF